MTKILSYSGPVGVCSVNWAELIALWMDLHQAFVFNLQGLLVKGDLLCAI